MWTVMFHSVLFFNFLPCLHTININVKMKNNKNRHKQDNTANHQLEHADTASVISVVAKGPDGNFYPLRTNDSTYQFTEGQDIEVNCEANNYHYLEWQVDQYKLDSKNYPINTYQIFMDIRLTREDHGLTISCVTIYDDSNNIENVTFLYLDQSKNTARQPEPIEEYDEGDPVFPLPGYSCIMIYPNLKKTVPQQAWQPLIDIVEFEHNNAIRSCAKLEKIENTKSALNLKKTLIIVNDVVLEVATQRGHRNITNNDVSFPTMPVVAGCVSVAVTALLIYLFVFLRKRRERISQDEQIYAEPQVVYAVIDVNGQGSRPVQENAPYAKIIGVVKPKKSDSPKKKPLLPRRNDNTRNETDNTRTDTDNTRRHTDETQKDCDNIRKVTVDNHGDDNNYSVIQHQNH